MPRKLFPSLLCPTEKVTEEQLATDRALLEMDRTIHAVSRRSFFSNLTALGAAAAAAAILTSTRPVNAQTAGPSILDVLNFALNLEYLEANLYISVSGQPPLPPGYGVGQIEHAPGKLKLDTQTLDTAANLAIDETHHIALLRETIFELGGTPINQPPIDYSAGGKVSITTEAQFLAVARQFTHVGNSAYAGGAQYLISNPFILTVAGEILGAEGQHLGGLNYLCVERNVISPALDTIDVPPVPAPVYNFFSVTPTEDLTTGPALGPIRTPQQVLGIVFGVSTKSTTTPPPNITHGGFFPKGVNGAITST